MHDRDLLQPWDGPRDVVGGELVVEDCARRRGAPTREELVEREPQPEPRETPLRLYLVEVPLDKHVSRAAEGAA
jgi:hypothetical protein